MSVDLDTALKDIPEGLRCPLIDLYEGALSEFRAGKWEAVGTKAGKICEVIYSISHGKISGSYPSRPSKPSNMVAECRKLEEHNKKYGRSLCIQIPRVLVAVYEIRNNRDIGHVGSDVDPNHMDAEFVMRAVQWLIAELVRVFGKLDVDRARVLVEGLTERTFHVVWADGEQRRILNPELGYLDQVIVLLYASGHSATIKQLQGWSGYKNSTEFKTKVLTKLHKAALIHVDGEDVKLLPPGIREVERRGLLSH